MTRAKDISPFAIRIPAGIRMTSLGNGMKELSSVIRRRIPKYPSAKIVVVRNSIEEWSISDSILDVHQFEVLE